MGAHVYGSHIMVCAGVSVNKSEEGGGGCRVLCFMVCVTMGMYVCGSVGLVG